MSKVSITPWTDSLFDTREAEFSALVLAGVENMTDTVIALLRKQEIITAAQAPPPPAPGSAPPPQGGIPAGAQAAALASWNIWVETELLPSATDVFREGGELVMDALADVFGQGVHEVIPPVGNTYADEYLQHAYNRMVGVGENVWKGIKRELQAGLDAGEGIKELSARLQSYAALSEGRANTVARTEVISSANAGSYLQMVEAGLEDCTKEWLATDDHRTRISHVHADDQQVPLTAEFAVEVYAQGELLGTEPMEFPGDPIATPANVINCRCSLGFSFDDEQGDGSVLTAAAFVEKEHPRDSKGKFMNKLEIDLLKAADKAAFLDKLTTKEKAQIGKATKDKAGVGGKDTDSGPPLGGLDKKTGKKAPAGKPVFLRVKTLFETDYEDGAIVAVRPDTNERVVWDAGTKRMQLQHLNKDGDWKTLQSFTRGALMKEAKDEKGWFTPSPENTTPVETPGIGPLLPEPPAGSKPVKLRTQVVYSKKYGDGETVAVHPADGLAVVWDEKSKRMLVQRDGETQESLTRGALMAKYKDADGWFTPPVPVTSDITPDIDEMELEVPGAPVPDITGVSLTKNQLGTLAGMEKLGAVYAGQTSPAKGMYTSTYSGLEKLGLIEAFTADHPNVPGQDALWYRPTDKGRAVLAAGITPTPAAKPKTFYVEYDGKVEKRTSAKEYTHASVVHFPWDGGQDVVYSWHTSEALAQKSTLTGMQKQQGAYVKAVLAVSNKPITPSVVPSAHVPESPQASAPTPADIPNTPTPDGGIPAPAALTNTGTVLGSHGAMVYKDNSTGKEWLFKPSPAGMGTFMADADIATARLREQLGLPTPTFGKITIDGKSGSIQEMYAGATDPFGYNFQPQDLNSADLLTIQKEHIFDWLVGNHDGHSRNYVRLPSGELIGIDKGQAFKFFGSDSLDPSFKPNNSMPAANLLMQAFANGEGGGAAIHALYHPEIKKIFKKLDDIFNSDYREILRPYAVNAAKQNMLAKGGPSYLGLTAPTIPANDVEAFLDLAESRKMSLQDDFKALYADLAQKRKAKIASQSALPLEDFPATPVPVQSATAGGVPVKLNAAKLQVAKYSHGEVVAVQNSYGERLIWDANIKKYTLQSGNEAGTYWLDIQSFNKSAAVKYFSNDYAGKGWTLPTGSGTHADMPVPLPKVAGSPPVAPTPVAAYTKLDFLAQGDDYSSIPSFLHSSFYNEYLNGGTGLVIHGNSTPEQIFTRLLDTQQRVIDELGHPVSLLALARLTDRMGFQRALAKFPEAINTRPAENAVLKLLSTPEGANFAGGLVHGYANAQANVAKTHDAVKAIKVSKPSKANLSSASFGNMDAQAGRDFYAEIAPELSTKHIQTVSDYTTNDYTQINGNLRGVDRYGDVVAPSEAEYIRAGYIQESMRPIPKHIRLYRGAGPSALGFTGDFGDNPARLEKLEKMVGKTFQDPGFTSTSVDKDKSFSYETFKFVIEAPKGTPGIYVEPISKNHKELEMLLAAGTKFKIISVEKTDISGANQYQIVMRVVA